MKKIAFLSLVLSFLLTACGNMATLVPPTPTNTFLPTVIPTIESSETPVPPVLSPEYASLQTLFDAENIPYQISDNKIIIDDASTSTIENIALSPELGKITKTYDGLAKNIITAVDTNNNRMVFVDGFGWVKDISPAESSLYNRIKIPYEWTLDKNNVLNTALNTIISLHYAENPTIPPDAPDPNDWIDVNYYGGPVFFLSLSPLNGRQVDPEYNPRELKKSFDWAGVFETTAPNGDDIVILAQTRKNATPENPNQLINLFSSFDKNTVDKYTAEQGENSAIMDVLESEISQLALVFSPPEGFPWAGGNLSFAGGYTNPTVAELYSQGEIFSLLRPEDQQIMLDKLGSEVVASDYSTKIPFIPPEFALRIFYAAIDSW